MSLGLILAAAGAQAQAPAQAPTAPPTNGGNAAVPPPAPITPLPPAADDPDLDYNPPDTTQRVGGLADAPLGGGADCRTACDKAYYICLAGEDSDGCPQAWSQCLTACPRNSSNF